MKKSKHISGLAQEKMRLRIQQLEQENTIRQLWHELKTDLKPGTILRNKLKGQGEKKTDNEPLLPHLLHYGINYISRRISKKAEKKIETTLAKGVEKIQQKINTVFKKK